MVRFALSVFNVGMAAGLSIGLSASITDFGKAPSHPHHTIPFAFATANSTGSGAQWSMFAGTIGFGGSVDATWGHDGATVNVDVDRAGLTVAGLRRRPGSTWILPPWQVGPFDLA
jgi:hypothetical protein